MALLSLACQSTFVRLAVLFAVVTMAACGVEAQGLLFTPPVQVSGDANNLGEMQLALGPNGNIYLVWSTSPCTNSPCTTDVFFSRSADGGATFSTPVNLSNDGKSDYPYIAVDSDGNINLIWSRGGTTGGLEYVRSSDGGTTFSAPTNIGGHTDPLLQYGYSKPQLIATDSEGNIDVVWDDYNSGYEQIVFSRSVDGGTSFSSPVKISSSSTPPIHAIYPVLAVGPDGTINVAWQQTSPGVSGYNLYFTRSADGGGTFSTPLDLSTNPVGVFYDDLVADAKGNLDAVWSSDCPDSDLCPVTGSEVYFSQSRAGGIFSAPTQITNLDGKAEAPSVAEAVDPKGNINVTWPEGTTQFFSRSVDGGATFSAPEAISNPAPGGAGSDTVTADANGDINVAFGRKNVYIERSADGGKTFSQINVTSVGGGVLNMAVDPSGNTSLGWVGYNSNSGKYDVFFSRGTVTTSSPLASLTLNPSTVYGSISTTGTVTLSAPAPSTGLVVYTTAGGGAVVPFSVTIPAGSSSADFEIDTSSVSTQTTIPITVTLSGNSQTASLTVLPSHFSSLTLDPATVPGGISSTATVTLVAPAQAGGQLVCLSSHNTDAATVPNSITIPPGASSGQFTITTVTVPGTTVVGISACMGADSITTNLVITAAAPSFSVTANPTSIVIPSPGMSASTTLTFTSHNGLTGSGALSSSTCGTAASESITCTLTAFTLPANGTATATLTVMTNASSGSLAPADDKLMLMLLSCAALGLATIPRKRGHLSFAFVAVVLAMVFVSAGCGSSRIGSATQSSGTPVGAVQSVSVPITINGTTQIVPNLTVTVQ
jgi:hypothetical protein